MAMLWVQSHLCVAIHAELQRLYIFQKKATSVQVYRCLLLLLLRGVMFQTFKLMSAPAPAGLAREGGAAIPAWHCNIL